MKLEDMNRAGLTDEAEGFHQMPHENLRLTIPVREALERAGARVQEEPRNSHGNEGVPTWRVTLADTVPGRIVAVCIAGQSCTGLRLDNEPEYPNEIGADPWVQLDFTPCPTCHAPLMWYEAGYVPGYRVCAKTPFHHFLAR